MPVRSLRSSVLRWPDLVAVDQAVRTWAARLAQARPEIVRIGYFGSYARGDWGVGSDLDVVVIVRESDSPFARRALAFDTISLPVPVDLLVYTAEEWAELTRRPGFARTADAEAIWVVDSI